MDYKKMYKDKLISVKEALEKINDGDNIFTGTAAVEPQEFMNNLHTISDRINCVNVFNSLVLKPYLYQSDERYKGKFNCSSFFMMDASRKSFAKGITSPIPTHLHNCIKRFLDDRSINVFVCACTPMDKHGYVRCSLSVLTEKEVFDAANMVIMEVNENMPVVCGDTEYHISEIDYFIESKNEIPTLPNSVLNDEDKRIGNFVATLVNDGDTVQFGIGAIPDAIVQSLMNKKDLGIHTEMLTSSIVDLVEAGVITGRKKTLHNRKIVAGFILGSKKLYDFVDNNPSVMLMSSNYVNSPWIIAKNNNMVSINSCLEVDLTGQICSESIGFRPFSGSGGQNDTAEGAIHSNGGRSIIAMHSTKKDGLISSIAPMLKEGAVVTLSRNNIDFVVTEYGIANLKSRNIRERTLSLIQIAHPKFREELINKAKELNYI